MRYLSLVVVTGLLISAPPAGFAQQRTDYVVVPAPDSGQLPARLHPNPYYEVKKALGVQNKRILDAKKEGRIDPVRAKELFRKVTRAFTMLQTFASQNGGPVTLTPDQARRCWAACDDARFSIDAALGPAGPRPEPAYSQPLQPAPPPRAAVPPSRTGPCSGTLSGDLVVGCGQALPCVFSGNLTITCPGYRDLSAIQTFSGNLKTCVQPVRMPQTFSGRLIVDPSVGR